MGTTAQAVAALIPKVLLPFNLVKATLNGAIVLLLYKPLSNALVRAGLMRGLGGRREGGSSRLLTPRTLLLWGISILIIAACAAVLIVGLGGSFKLFA
jgi:hypothetical protein